MLPNPIVLICPLRSMMHGADHGQMALRFAELGAWPGLALPSIGNLGPNMTGVGVGWHRKKSSPEKSHLPNPHARPFGKVGGTLMARLLMDGIAIGQKLAQDSF
jgi:hypothetical protein